MARTEGKAKGDKDGEGSLAGWVEARVTYATCFSGIGGWELGLNACGWKLRWQCERDRFCRTLLNERFGVPICPDIGGLYQWLRRRFGNVEAAQVDALIGSPPCQPFSVAGKKCGTSDERHLYPAFIYAVRKLRPRYVLMEQVPNVLGIDNGRAFGEYAGGLVKLGYDLVWHRIPACAVGANHQRLRLWIVAYATGGGIRRGGARREAGQLAQLCEAVPDSTSERCREAGQHSERSAQWTTSSSEVLADPERGRRREQLRIDAARESVLSAERTESASGAGSGGQDVANARRERNNGRRERIAGGKVSGRRTEAERSSASVPVERCGDAVSDTGSSGPSEQGFHEKPMYPAASSNGQANRPFDAGWWAVEPDVGRSLDGFSNWLDGYFLSIKSHNLLSAYAEGKDSGPQEVLHSLRSYNSEENVQWETGGCGGISPTKVLLTYLRKLEAQAADQAWLQLASEKVPCANLRELRSDKQPSRPSHRSGHFKQRPAKHPNTLQALSQLLACDTEKAWARYCRAHAVSPLNAFGPDWEVGLRRVASGVPNRVDRLKGLGNAVVPQIPYLIGQAINQIEAEAECLT